MHKVDVYRDKRGLGFPDAAKLIRRAVKTTLKCEKVENECMVSVTLTDNDGIREINREQRNIDSATDVLSFPMNELVPGAFDPEDCEFDYEYETIYLGDMVISLQRCQEQAEEFGHSFQREVCYLTCHSVLHLLGYDHMDEGPQKRQMREREEAIMAVMGL